jgi:hypothetical protein
MANKKQCELKLSVCDNKHVKRAVDPYVLELDKVKEMIVTCDKCLQERNDSI